MIEQHTAPNLDAVAAYAFRGTARYHVPGHKGGPGADPGLRDRGRRAGHRRAPEHTRHRPGTFADPVREGGAINVLREG
jgi:hypothetical protein